MGKAVNELAEITARVQLKALRAAEKALLEAGDEGFDGSGDIPWKERPTRVAAGLMLAQKAMERVQSQESDTRAFQLMVMRDRYKSVSEWEKHAAEVDGPGEPARLGAMPAKEETK